MNPTISARLFHCLLQSRTQLSAEALRRITAFVGSQQTEEGAFVDRNGTPDLYYTAFGRMLGMALGIPFDAARFAGYLARQEADELDLVHYAAYMRCRLATEPNFTVTSVRPLQSFKMVPNKDLHSPYTRFVYLSLLEDTGHFVVNDWQPYTDSPMNDDEHALTHLCASLMIRGQLTGYAPCDAIYRLRDRQDDNGGFHSTPHAPVPDMLSTSTALFVLQCYSIPPRYSTADFLSAHWLDSGGFAATLFDDDSDVEYTFYGLLMQP
ncbi:MAG: hypothetical protein LBN06_03145 [Prevotellaceae bacterium]|jgi:prenyltransferase beta subunit|nr:hypothetical protein [Prevotellaceae bacterium]